MTDAGRAELGSEEKRRAEEELLAAQQLLDMSLGRIAVTRAYFASFTRSEPGCSPTATSLALIRARSISSTSTL